MGKQVDIEENAIPSPYTKEVDDKILLDQLHSPPKDRGMFFRVYHEGDKFTTLGIQDLDGESETFIDESFKSKNKAIRKGLKAVIKKATQLLDEMED